MKHWSLNEISELGGNFVLRDDRLVSLTLKGEAVDLDADCGPDLLAIESLTVFSDGSQKNSIVPFVAKCSLSECFQSFTVIDGVVDSALAIAIGDCKNIRRLYFERSSVATELQSAINEIQPNLIDLSSSNVDDRFILGLELPNLEWLSLADCSLSNACLPGLFKMHALETLLLHRNSISEADFSGLQKLKVLRLDETNVSNDTLQSLGSLEFLEYLHVDDTNVDENGLEFLKQLPRLREVTANDTAISEAALEKFEQALPFWADA